MRREHMCTPGRAISRVSWLDQIVVLHVFALTGANAGCRRSGSELELVAWHTAVRRDEAKAIPAALLPARDHPRV